MDSNSLESISAGICARMTSSPSILNEAESSSLFTGFFKLHCVLPSVQLFCLLLFFLQPYFRFACDAEFGEDSVDTEQGK